MADYLGPGLAPKLNNCRTCHLQPETRAPTPSEDRPHNAFGKRLKAVRGAAPARTGQPSGIPARLQAIAGEDSDGDGVPNLLELVTGHFPGEAGDKPAASNWPAAAPAIAALRAVAERIPVEPVRARSTARRSRSSVIRPRPRSRTRSTPSSPPSATRKDCAPSRRRDAVLCAGCIWI